LNFDFGRFLRIGLKNKTSHTFAITHTTEILKKKQRETASKRKGNEKETTDERHGREERERTRSPTVIGDFWMIFGSATTGVSAINHKMVFSGDALIQLEEEARTKEERKEGMKTKKEKRKRKEEQTE
jgi:hypothetical protein